MLGEGTVPDTNKGRLGSVIFWGTLRLSSIMIGHLESTKSVVLNPSSNIATLSLGN